MEEANKIIPYLSEMRLRLIRVIILFIGLFVACFYFAEKIFNFLLKPLLLNIPQNNHLIATDITSPIFIPIQLAYKTALLISAPIILIEIWRFIKPALYKKEKISLLKSSVTICFLFISGLLFCYFLVLPLIISFFVKNVPSTVTLMPDMASSTSFILQMLLLFGLSFQVPLITSILVKIKIITLLQLIKLRPYIVVAIFTVSMLLTPPDVISQMILAIPLCILFELGILYVKITAKKEQI